MKPHFVSFISKCFQFDGCAKTTQTYIKQGKQASHSSEAVMRTNAGLVPVPSAGTTQLEIRTEQGTLLFS